MVPDETTSTGTPLGDRPVASRPASRRRSGRGRGRRGRGSRVPRNEAKEPHPTNESEAAESATDLAPAPTVETLEPPFPGPESKMEPPTEVIPPLAPPIETVAPAVHEEPVSHRGHRPASPESVKSAIVEVNRIIDTLRETIDDMEEVLETLEIAERQKEAEEREIESLRRALRHLQRPRDSGGYQSRGHA